MTRISFLMPTFNRAELIGISLASILPQMAAEDELIVIDDGSTDNTSAILESFGSAIRTVRQENAGKSAALNHGLARATGEFIWVCDDDDILRPGAVAHLSHAIESRDLEVVFARYTRIVMREGQVTDVGTGYWPDLSTGSLGRHILEDCFVMQNATLARRTAYDAVGPFNETLPRSLDYEMAIRLVTQTRTGFEDIIAYSQREHDGVRGPQAAQHAAGQSETVWQQHDANIFRMVREQIPLSYYEAMFAHSDPSLVRRAALLQRGCVMARHHLWEFALADFAAAAEAASNRPLGNIERAVCARATAGKFGLSAALAPEVIAQLKKMTESGGIIAAIVHNILRGSLWRLRNEDQSAAKDARSLIISVLGTTGMMSLSAQHMARKLVQEADNGLVERRELPLLNALKSEVKQPRVQPNLAVQGLRA